MSMVSVWVMKLLEKFEAVARQRRLAENTIDAYRSWIQQFLRFSANARGQWTRPEQLGTADVEAFLNDLVSRRRLSASSQNQALNALVFLYAQVVDVIPENHLGKFTLLRSARPKRVPTVLSTVEVKRVIEAIPHDHISRLLTELM
jgi:site-specific recombinase XerD